MSFGVREVGGILILFILNVWVLHWRGLHEFTHHTDFAYFNNPVGDAHTRLANGLQARSTRLQLGGSTLLKAWPSLPSFKQLSQYQRVLKEHKQPFESQRFRKRGKQTLKAGHAKKNTPTLYGRESCWPFSDDENNKAFWEMLGCDSSPLCNCVSPSSG